MIATLFHNSSGLCMVLNRHLEFSIVEAMIEY